MRQGIEGGWTAHGHPAPSSIALALGLRHDWGPQYRARQCQAEIKWLGIRSTPTYVGEPECNGVAERFIRTPRSASICTTRNPRGGQSGDRGLHPVLQQKLAPPAARVHDPGPCTREGQPEGGLMFKSSTCPENQGPTLALLVFDLESTEGVVSEGHSRGVAQVVFKRGQQCCGVRNLI